MTKQVKDLFKENKFGIRKLTIGAASIIVGTTMYMGIEHHNEAHAAELDQSTSTQQNESTQKNTTNNQTLNSQQEQPQTDQSNTQQNQNNYTDVSATNEKTSQEYKTRSDNQLPKNNEQSSPKVNTLAATQQAGDTTDSHSAASNKNQGSYNGTVKVSNVKTEPIPFETDYQYNENLELGAENVKVQGQDGEKITEREGTYYLANKNKDNQDSLKEYNDSHDNDVINRGVNDLKRNFGENVETGDVTYDNLHDKDVDEFPDENQKGYSIPFKSTSERIVKKPQNQVVEYGPVEEPFKTQYKTNRELNLDEERVVQEGVVGLRDPRTNEVIKEPQNRIIERGVITKTEVNTGSKPFEIITKDNPDIVEGKTRIAVPGENGIIVTTTEQDYDKDGNKVGEPRVTTETTKEAVDQIVEIGTKKAENPVDVDTTKPMNKDNQPKGGTIDKKDGQPVTPDEIVDQVTTPDYNGEKPLVTVDNPKQIPDGTVNGEHKVSVTVKYPDGSTDHTVVTVNVNEDQGVVTPTEATPPVNPDHSHDHDGIHDMTPKENGNGIQNQEKTSTSVEKQVDNDNYIKNNTSNQLSKGLGQTSQVKEQAIQKVMKDKHISREDVIKHHTKAIDKEISKSKAKVLPETGQENTNGGLIASIIAVVGLGAIFTARRKKTNN